MNEALYSSPDGVFALFEVKGVFVVMSKGHVYPNRESRIKWQWAAGPFRTMEEGVTWIAKAPRAIPLPHKRGILKLVK